VSEPALKLTTYFGERDRADGAFLADALAAAYARTGLKASVILRGAAGFGVHHGLRTDRLLTLSEDLPMVSVAVDAPARIEAVLPEVRRLSGHGLITLERGTLAGAGDLALPEGDVKLTLYAGRGARPSPRALVDVLHRHGVAGASVLLGVDGTAHGRRRRARLLGPNAHVPVEVVAVGEGATVAAALGELTELVPAPLATVERVVVCKRDGRRLAEPPAVPARDSSGLALWQKLTVYGSEATELLHGLRSAGAMGATVLRGTWGYHGDHAPHGDRLRQLRRRVPVVCVTVDEPERIRTLFALVDALTGERGLVTCETVPALRASGPDVERGGLRLARPG
jgi:PII-like signaling protein